MNSCDRSFVRSFVHSFIIQPFIHSFIRSFARCQGGARQRAIIAACARCHARADARRQAGARACCSVAQAERRAAGGWHNVERKDALRALEMVLGLAPASSNSVTVASQQRIAAMCSAVSPSIATASTSAPESSRCFMTFMHWLPVARCRGVVPFCGGGRRRRRAKPSSRLHNGNKRFMRI